MPWFVACPEGWVPGAIGSSGASGCRTKKEVVPMRRILTVLAVAFVMAAMMLAIVVPAFAVANPNANFREHHF
jgi:hypothetical protein